MKVVLNEWDVFPDLYMQRLLSVKGLPVFKYLSDSIEPYDAGPVTGLSPSVVKRKNAALRFNRLNAAPGKLMRLVNYKDIF